MNRYKKWKFHQNSENQSLKLKKYLKRVATVFLHLLSNNQSSWTKNIYYLVYLAILAVPQNYLKKSLIYDPVACNGLNIKQSHICVIIYNFYCANNFLVMSYKGWKSGGKQLHGLIIHW